MARSKRCLSCRHCKRFRTGPGLYQDDVELSDKEIENQFYCDYLSMTGKRADKEPGKKSCKSYKKINEEDKKKIRKHFANDDSFIFKED